MKPNEPRASLPSELRHGLATLATLRDEIRLQMHLATLEAKQEWNDVLEPKLYDVIALAEQGRDEAFFRVGEMRERLETWLASAKNKGYAVKSPALTPESLHHTSSSPVSQPSDSARRP